MEWVVLFQKKPKTHLRGGLNQLQLYNFFFLILHKIKIIWFKLPHTLNIPD